jgi:hypothetical protein
MACMVGKDEEYRTSPSAVLKMSLTIFHFGLYPGYVGENKQNFSTKFGAICMHAIGCSHP